MTNTQEEENIEIDTTEEKAKAIGKEIGAVEDTPAEDVPDYDIVEEPDERIAKEREPRAEKTERKSLTNKEKRQLRKQRINSIIDGKDAVISAQQEEINQLKRWKGEVDIRLSGINQSEVQKAWDANVAAFAQAEKDHMDAFAEGDGAKATKAMRLMYDAQRNIDKLHGVKQQLEKQPAAEQQEAAKPSAVDSAVVNKAKSWAERNSWYKADGSDTDSEIAKAISGVLANEGYDPKTDDFWDELDDRLTEKKIGAAVEQDDEPAPKQPRKRAAPPVANGSARGDVVVKKTITLPTSYINMLKANGIWDDVKRRNKIIADRERIIRESAH